MDLALDQDGDLALAGGDLLLLRGVDAVMQRIRIRLRLFRGEWFLDESAGIPYFGTILGAKLGRQALAAIFRDEIKRVRGVESIESVDAEIDRTRRTARIRFRVRADGGELAEGTEEISP